MIRVGSIEEELTVSSKVSVSLPLFRSKSKFTKNGLVVSSTYTETTVALSTPTSTKGRATISMTTVGMRLMKVLFSIVATSGRRLISLLSRVPRYTTTSGPLELLVKVPNG